MYRLPIKDWKRPLAWKQLVPSCSHTGCPIGTSWTGVLHRATGFWLNEREWLCSPRCLEASLEERLNGHFYASPSPEPMRTTMPMGLMLLARGVISDAQFRDALDIKRVSGDRIGSCLQRLGCVSFEDIASVVATQWGCPVFPVESVQPGCSLFVPLSLLERYRMLPVHLVSQGRRLFIAFCDKIDHSALISIEQMLGCETEACVIPEPKLLQELEYRKRDTTGEVTVRRPDTSGETARVIRSYAQQTGSSAIRLCVVDGNVWARFFSRRSHLDLVFEVAST